MRKQLLALVVSVSIMLMGCASVPANAQTRLLGDMRFAHDLNDVVGESLEIIIDKFGPAEVLPNGCRVPLFKDGRHIGEAQGDSLKYSGEGENSVAERYICVVKGVAVGDKRRMAHLSGSKLHISTLETVDDELAAKLVTEGMNLPNLLQDYNDPVIPPGKGFEI